MDVLKIILLVEIRNISYAYVSIREKTTDKPVRFKEKWENILLGDQK